MNEGEVDRACKGLIIDHPEVEYCGSLMSDEWLRLKPPRGGKGVSFAIMNTLQRRDRLRMGHWITLLLDNSSIYYFDSYGLVPITYSSLLQQCIDYYTSRGYEYVNCARRLQSATSLVCGAYAIVFAREFIGGGLEGILSMFDRLFSKTNYDYNDRKVITYAYKNLRMPRCIRTFCRGAETYAKCIKTLCSDQEKKKKRIVGGV